MRPSPTPQLCYHTLHKQTNIYIDNSATHIYVCLSSRPQRQANCALLVAFMRQQQWAPLVDYIDVLFYVFYGIYHIYFYIFSIFISSSCYCDFHSLLLFTYLYFVLPFCSPLLPDTRIALAFVAVIVSFVVLLCYYMLTWDLIKYLR